MSSPSRRPKLFWLHSSSSSYICAFSNHKVLVQHPTIVVRVMRIFIVVTEESLSPTQFINKCFLSLCPGIKSFIPAVGRHRGELLAKIFLTISTRQGCVLEMHFDTAKMFKKNIGIVPNLKKHLFKTRILCQE